MSFERSCSITRTSGDDEGESTLRLTDGLIVIRVFRMVQFSDMLIALSIPITAHSNDLTMVGTQVSEETSSDDMSKVTHKMSCGGPDILLPGELW